MRLPRALLPAVLAGAVLSGAAPALAAFGDSVSAPTGTLSGAVLGGPSTMTTSLGLCRGGLLGLPLLSKRPVVEVSWTPWADLLTSTSPLRGQVLEVVVDGQSYIALTDAPVTATTSAATVVGYATAGGDVALSTSTTYGFSVRTTWAGWTSAPTTRTRTTSVCL